jgi:EAL domain-containing protein (putative c-di-GMP-specific phosphodiesterase class I)
VLEQVLKKIRSRMSAKEEIVPQSINLSRSDFETCDIVEEIRKRVDDAGVERNMISVEITEGIIGENFDYMKEQISRFQDLGFKVWMDDFGSGYSSLNVLHSISFDLIKFDQNFTKKLLEEERGRIIMKDMMKMAESLQVDTICEGVETKEQALFLREIGCSKQQGYYYGKPCPLETRKTE